MAKKAAGATPVTTPANQAWTLLETSFRERINHPSRDRGPEREAVERLVPLDQQVNIEAILQRDRTPSKAYRTLLFIQLAYRLALGSDADLTRQQVGGRGRSGVDGKLHGLLRAAHITSPVDAYQNIGKGSGTLDNGHFPASDNFLRWASKPERTLEQLEAVFQFACSEIVSTARPVLPFPELNPNKLSFAAVMNLFVELLAVPSGGAYQQFIVAAVLHAKVRQAAKGQTVTTKNLTASDKSGGDAADVQIKSGNDVVEGFEVTANSWSVKLGDAASKIRANDLPRLHIVARVDEAFGDVLRELLGLGGDLSVLELTNFVAGVVAETTNVSRALALLRLYELLDRHQPVINRVNDYVKLLESHGLTVPAGTSS